MGMCVASEKVKPILGQELTLRSSEVARLPYFRCQCRESSHPDGTVVSLQILRFRTSASSHTLRHPCGFAPSNPKTPRNSWSFMPTPKKSKKILEFGTCAPPKLQEFLGVSSQYPPNSKKFLEYAPRALCHSEAAWSGILRFNYGDRPFFHFLE